MSGKHLCCLLMALYISARITGLSANGENLPKASLKPAYYQLKIKHGGSKNALTHQIELLEVPGNHLMLPVRYLCDLLEIQAEQLSQGALISLQVPKDQKLVMLDSAKHQITYSGDTLIEPEDGIIHNTNGLLSPDDLYVEQKKLESLLNVTITVDTQKQEAFLSTPRTLKAIIQKVQDAPDPNTALQSGIQGQVWHLADLPANSIDTLGVDFHSQQYKERQVTPVFGQELSKSVQLVNYGASLTTYLTGRFSNVPFEFSPRWRLQNGQLRLSDFQWCFKKKLGGLQGQLGSLQAGLSALVSPNASVWGMQLATSNAEQREILPLRQYQLKGQVDREIPVVLEVDGQVRQMQIPEQGQYAFEPLELEKHAPHHLRVLQGQLVVEEQSIPAGVNSLDPKTSAFSLFAGRIAPVFQPMGSNWLALQSNKWLMGGRISQGLGKYWTIGASMAGDSILGKPATSLSTLLLSQPAASDLSGYTSYWRDPNLESGLTAGVSLLFQPGVHARLQADLAASLLKPSSNSLSQTGPDWAGRLEMDYHWGNFQLLSKIFHYGSQFYTPGASIYNQLFDRQGLSGRMNACIRKIQLQGELEQYRTNLSSTLPGGFVHVNRYQLNLFRALNSRLDTRISVTGLTGNNDERNMYSRNYQAEFNALLGHSVRGQLAYSRANNQYLYNPGNPSQLVTLFNQKSLYDTVKGSLNVALPKGNLQGSVALSKTMNLLSFNAVYNWKRFAFEPFLQQSFMSEQKLLTGGLGILFQQKNGQKIGLRYTYGSSTLPGIAFFNAPLRKNSHLLQLDAVDTFAFLKNQLVSLGELNRQTPAYVDGVVFLDLNRNGIQEKNEPGLPGIHLLADQGQPVKSTRKGDFILPNTNPGLHQVDFDWQQLPIGYQATTPAFHYIAENGKRSRVVLGLITTPGKLSGKVRKWDHAKNPLPSADILVGLYDASNKLVQYTYTDQQGNYRIQNVSPGNYALHLDESQVLAQGLDLKITEHTVMIPYDKRDTIDLANLDFEVVQKFSP